MDAAVQGEDAGEQRSSGGKTFARVIRQVRQRAHHRRISDELVRLDQFHRHGIAEQFRRGLPRHRQAGRDGRDLVHNDMAGGDDFEPRVQALDAEETHAVAEIIRAHFPHARLRHDAQVEVLALLRRRAARLHAGGVVRDRHGLGVVVNGAMDDAVVHGWAAVPVREIAAWAK